MSVSDSAEPPSERNQAPRLTYAEMIEDLGSIPINETDVLFEKFGDEAGAASDELSERLEGLILFKANLELESEGLKSGFRLADLSDEFEALDKRLGSLQNFIEISKKFFSIDKN